MDRSNFNVMSLFSKPASPPPPLPPSPSHSSISLQQQHNLTQSPNQHPSPTLSYREPAPPSPPKSLDSLFRSINPASASSTTLPISVASDSNVTPPATTASMNPFRTQQQQSIQQQQQQQQQNNSAPATPLSSITQGSGSSAASGGAQQPPADRQSALLSLLGSTVGSNSNNTNSNMNPNNNNPSNSTVGAGVAGMGAQQAANQPHQSPTPPGERTRPLPMPMSSGSEAQGKILLEQLMSGNLGSSGYSDASQGFYSPPAPISYPPQPYGPFMSDALPPHQAQYASQEQPRDVQQGASPPSPSRKSMFEFVSPFDALAATAAPVKTVPKPINDPAIVSSELSSEADSSWLSAASDPKRKSMENLMDQLTRSAPHSSAQQQQQQQHTQTQIQHQLDPYGPELAGSPPSQAMQFQQRDLYGASKPVPGSPRGSPPRPYPHMQSQHRINDSPRSSGLMHDLSAKPRGEASPVRGGWKSNTDSIRRKPKAFVNSPTPSQSITFDVAQVNDDIQASRDCVKSTAIALVKVDPTFLPGTTIGATHWVAYAMTRGRVRVISRSSGDRTLLQLPAVFPQNVSVTDMAVYGNRLAGVTSDGGFVVWELPETITDDVPGKVLVCILPTADFEPLHSVKWHPKDVDTLAVASDSNIHLMNVAKAADVFQGQPFTQVNLHRVAQIFSVSSPLISFDFDVPHQAIATISEDSVLTLWNIPDKLPFWSQKIGGDGIPSSLTFLEGGVVIGRKNGTIFQLLPVMGDVILSTVKFLNNGKEDPDMFGHVTYDSRIQTLWVANSKRDSLIALKVCFELSTPSPGGEELIRGGYFDQLVEFVGPKPTLNFVILTADADPTGDEANAACVAAKLPPGELALVAFSVHSSGVDQVLIRKEWYESGFMSTNAKLPPFHPTLVPAAAAQRQGVPQQQQQQQAQPQPAPALPPVISQPIPSAPIRLRTPPSEEVEMEHANKEDGRPQDAKVKSVKAKNVGWKDREDSNGSGREKGKEREKASDAQILSDSALGVALSKEIRKVEESLHTRIGRLIAKELDKQQQRLDEARASEQAADFARQEKILKLISTELTKNTTRVVEAAVKGEVQNSVLPSLENITKNEVKSAINNQMTRGLGDSVRATLPVEIEKMLIKPEVANQLARNLTSSLVPAIERHVKDAVQKTLLPAYQAQSSAMHQELSREIHSEITNLKKDVINWQSEALRGQEGMIRDMDQAIRSLSEQVKFMTMNMPTAISHSQPSMQARDSPSSTSSNFPGASPMGQSHHRAGTMPTMGPTYPSFQTQTVPTSAMHGPWYGAPAPAPPSVGPSMAPPPQQTVQQPPAKTEEWDDTYLAVLGTQDLKQLRELLARSNPEVVMPTGGPGPLSQAVILTLVHRLAAALGETSPVDEAFKSSLWWLQRAATCLNTSDPLISPYIARVLPNVSSSLNTTKQRLGLLPGGPQLIDTTRLISDIQETLNRKPML